MNQAVLKIVNENFDVQMHRNWYEENHFAFYNFI